MFILIYISYIYNKKNTFSLNIIYRKNSHESYSELMKFNKKHTSIIRCPILDCITRKSGRTPPSTESNVIISESLYIHMPLKSNTFPVKSLFREHLFSQTSFQSNIFSVKRLFSQTSFQSDVLQKQTYLVFSHSLYVPGRLHIFRVSNIILLFSLSILLQISLCPTIITTKSVFKRKLSKSWY